MNSILICVLAVSLSCQAEAQPPDLEDKTLPPTKPPFGGDGGGLEDKTTGVPLEQSTMSPPTGNPGGPPDLEAKTTGVPLEQSTMSPPTGNPGGPPDLEAKTTGAPLEQSTMSPPTGNPEPPDLEDHTTAIPTGPDLEDHTTAIPTGGGLPEESTTADPGLPDESTTADPTFSPPTQCNSVLEACQGKKEGASCEVCIGINPGGDLETKTSTCKIPVPDKGDGAGYVSWCTIGQQKPCKNKDGTMKSQGHACELYGRQGTCEDKYFLKGRMIIQLPSKRYCNIWPIPVPESDTTTDPTVSTTDPTVSTSEELSTSEPWTPTTEAPTTEAPTTQAPKKCASWCEKDEAKWRMKCSWKKCKGCARCQQECLPACKEKWTDKPWSKKCGWKSCRLCPACNKCRAKCNPKSKPVPGDMGSQIAYWAEWKEKCKKSWCQDCDECAEVGKPEKSRRLPAEDEDEDGHNRRRSTQEWNNDEDEDDGDDEHLDPDDDEEDFDGPPDLEPTTKAPEPTTTTTTTKAPEPTTTTTTRGSVGLRRRRDLRRRRRGPRPPQGGQPQWVVLNKKVGKMMKILKWLSKRVKALEKKSKTKD